MRDIAMIVNRLRFVFVLSLGTMFGFYNNAQCMFAAAEALGRAGAEAVEANINAQLRLNREIAELNQQLNDERDPHRRAQLAGRIANRQLEQQLVNGAANAGKAVFDMGLKAVDRRANLAAYKEEKRADGEA